jgi:hypothetical protein
MADYNLGCTMRLDDERTLALLTEFYHDGTIHHIQVQAVPLSPPSSTPPTTATASTPAPPLPTTTVRFPRSRHTSISP